MLAIDAGNSFITSALFKGDIITKVFNISTKEFLNTGAYWNTLVGEVSSTPQHIIISSVLKNVADIIVKDIISHIDIRPFVIGIDTYMGIKNLYRSKNSLGIDRIINATAAYHLYTKERHIPAIIVDMGTATTIDYVTEDGEYLGGVIAPGLISAYKGLLDMAPALPEIDILPPSKAIGDSTDTCMRSGIILGHMAMIEEMVRLMMEERPKKTKTIITGGLSTIIRKTINKDFLFDPDLLLKGIYIIGKINQRL